MVDVAVIGGGISGLATAYLLRRQGHDVVVLERQAHAGGNTLSENFGGFLMEHGPSTVNAAMGEALALSRDLGLESARCDLGDEVRRRYLVKEGALAGISTHPMGFLLSNYLSLGARLRMMAEITVPRPAAGTEESIAEFCRRRFGSEFTDRIMNPLVGGLYAGRAEQLSVSAVFPRLEELENRFGSISWAAFRRRLQGRSLPGKRLYSWREGMGTLPRALMGSLGTTLRTGITVRRIGAVPGGFKVDAGADGTIKARTVVIASQPHVAAGLLEGTADDAATAAGNIHAPPLAVVFLGYERRQVDHPLDGLGYLTPTAEKHSLTGAQFSSTMFPGRAPKDHVAITGYLGGTRSPDLGTVSRAEAVDLVRAELADLIGARGRPKVVGVRHWPRSIPQYEIGHAARIATLDSTSESVPGLFVTGNYFDGPSVGSCVARATQTCATVDDYLSTKGSMRAAASRTGLN